MYKDPKYFTKDGLVRSEDNINFGVDYDILAGMYIKLNQRIKDLVSENTKLQNDLFTDQLQTDESEHQIEKLQNEIIELKTKLYDAHVK